MTKVGNFLYVQISSLKKHLTDRFNCGHFYQLMNRSARPFPRFFGSSVGT